MSEPLTVATMALQGAAAGVSIELAIRMLFKKKEKDKMIRIAKFLLGFFMTIKTILFLTFNFNQGDSCYITARVADLFYHLAMATGNHILFCRVQMIIPIDWRKKGFIFHTTLTVLRIIIGIVDVGLIRIEVRENGTCRYQDEKFWGPIYTIYDTLIDIYVTIVISVILINHIRSLVSDRMKVNSLLYTSVIYNNVFRTVLLTMVNLVSTILIIIPTRVPVLMLLWPIINIGFVILIGYDSDVTKTIQKLRQNNWRSISTSAIDLNRVSSTMKPPTEEQERRKSFKSSSSQQTTINESV